MNILISSNSSYFEAALILIKSLLVNNSNECVVYLLYSDLDAEQIKTMEELVKRYSAQIQCKKIDNEELKGLHTMSVSIEAYYRLLAPSILPENIDRILYLDIDMLVVGDISELYNTEFEGNYFVGVTDTSDSINELKHRLGMSYDTPYINSGVMLMNLKLLRKEIDYHEIFEFIRRFPEKVLCQDQDAINALFSDKIKLADWVYNYEARYHNIEDFKKYFVEKKKLLKEIKIIHYMGGANKPWKQCYQGKYLNIYHEYAKGTGFEAVTADNKLKRMWYLYKAYGQLKKNQKESEIRKNEKKFYDFYMLLSRWMQLIQEGNTVDTYLSQKGYMNVAIYGFKELGERLYESLDNTQIKVSYIIDRDSKLREKVSDIKIYSPDEKLDEVDAVIVTAIHYIDDIECMLKGRLNCPVISLEAVLYDMEIKKRR